MSYSADKKWQRERDHLLATVLARARKTRTVELSMLTPGGMSVYHVQAVRISVFEVAASATGCVVNCDVFLIKKAMGGKSKHA